MNNPEENINNETFVSSENSLELHSLSFRDKLKAKKARYVENTKDMSKPERFKYFVYYYKWHVILGILLLFCAIALPITIYKNSRPISLSYAIVNCDTPGRINQEPFEDYAEFYNISEGYQLLHNITTHLNLETYEEEMTKNPDNASYNQFPLLCFNNHFDIIITDKTGLDYCSVNGLIQPLEDRLTEDVLSIINTQYPQLIVMSPNYDDAETPYAIDISHTEFAKNLNLGYNDIYVCFPGGEERNFTNSKRFLNYVLQLDMTIQQ